MIDKDAIKGGKVMQIDITKNELYAMIKEAVRDVIREERIEIILRSIPDISHEEMKEIEDLYGNPQGKDMVAHREIIDL